MVIRVGSNSTILASRDRGATWQETSLGEDAMLTTIQFLDGEHAVISGEFGLFLTTADGGAHWVPGSRISDDFYPYAALFSDPSTGSVSGLGGVIVHTVDGGRTWTREPNRTGAPMYGVVGHGGETWALGVNGLVLKRTQREWMPTAHGLPAPWLRAGRSLGPTAMLAGARDAYSLSKFRARDLLDTVEWPGTWRLIRRHTGTALREIRHSVSARSLVKEAQRLVPGLTLEDVEPGPAGVRAQALARDGTLIDDFLVERTEYAVHVRNAPSPAATSSLALARLIADEFAG